MLGHTSCSRTLLHEVHSANITNQFKV